jgi:hypothetical protein
MDAQGQPYLLTNEMWDFLLSFYRVKEDAELVNKKGRSAWRSAMFYRRGLLVRPQKWGKGPFSAAMICVEAVGPARFGGWASDGDAYFCADYGCGCGFVYAYEPGDPMGVPWPTPLIQIVARSEEQADNVYDSLLPMIQLSKALEVLIPDAGRSRILLPNGGKIVTVTSQANSRLGQRVTFIVADEVGTWNTAELLRLAVTQRRGLAGMGGRMLETTNAWNPAENSVAQRTYEAALNVTGKRPSDLLVDFRQADPTLDYLDAGDRRKIHAWVYGDCWWVDLDRIDAEAAELIKDNPADAERFFGNRVVAGKGLFIQPALWAARTVADVPTRRIALGFDGSLSGDWTAIRAEDDTGLRFTPKFNIGGQERLTVWDPQDARNNGRVPRHEVRAAVAQLFAKYDVVRFYCDTREWESVVDEWAATYGEKKVIAFPTYSIARMYPELVRYRTDIEEHETEHLECEITDAHARNAVMVARGDKFILGKPQGSDHQKIDAIMADVLAHAAAADAHASGGWATGADRTVTFYS